MFFKNIVLNSLAINFSVQLGYSYWRNYLHNSLLLIYIQCYQLSSVISLIYNYVEAFINPLS